MIRRSALKPSAKPVRRRRPGPPRKGRIHDPQFMAFVAASGTCIVKEHGHTGCYGRITLHHVKAGPGAQKDDHRVVRLCEGHHLHDYGDRSIERLGRPGWEHLFQIDLDAEIKINNDRFLERWSRRMS